MKKLFLASVLFLLAVFLTPKVALAQGTCGCYDGGSPGECMPGASSCDAGHSPSQCYYGPSGCACDCVLTAGYCCNDNSGCPPGKECLSVIGGCASQGYFGECISTPPPTDNSRFCNGVDETGGINTAIGCIKVGSGNELVNTILRLAIGLGGGIALALILYGVFIVTTSAGMPDKLKAGSEIITSAVIGLIFILLSIFLVHLIGINILGIPGLL